MLLFIALISGIIEFHGQAIGQIGISDSLSHCSVNMEGEYRPRVEYESVTPTRRLDFVASVRAAIGSVIHSKNTSCRAEIDLYRLFLSYGSERYEVRLGLQQINFGSAMILRPLRWFDRIDPRDPLQTTAGVYGVLYRCYSGNDNAWFWGLIGNSKPKGLETTPTPKWFPEAGARLEKALSGGEMAGSFHHRWTVVEGDTVLEDKFGLDGRWDIGPGVWFEGTLVHTGKRWQGQIMGGVDHTFGIGNGLTVLLEHMITSNHTNGQNLSALSLTYPLGLNDNLSQLTFFDWQEHKPYIYLAWQHTLDNWQFLIAGYFNAAGKTSGIVSRVFFNH